jgi:hypothetical protein
MDKDTFLYLQALATPTLLAGFFGSILRAKYSNKFITVQHSAIYTNYLHGLINVNKLFQSDAKSLTPEGTVHDKITFRFMKCTIHTT